jgi:hypothetical protein
MTRVTKHNNTIFGSAFNYASLSGCQINKSSLALSRLGAFLLLKMNLNNQTNTYRLDAPEYPIKKTRWLNILATVWLICSYKHTIPGVNRQAILTMLVTTTKRLISKVQKGRAAFGIRYMRLIKDEIIQLSKTIF